MCQLLKRFSSDTSMKRRIYFSNDKALKDEGDVVLPDQEATRQQMLHSALRSAQPAPHTQRHQTPPAAIKDSRPPPPPVPINVKLETPAEIQTGHWPRLPEDRNT